MNDGLESFAGLPPRVSVPYEETVLTYWRERARQHTQDSYAGAALQKFPEDLRVYEHLLWATRANVVIELGALYGGSTLWFRDRLRAIEAYGRVEDPLVVAIDIDTSRARASLADADPAYGETIVLVEGDVCDPATAERVASVLPASARCLVVEDSAHTYETTTAALRGFARFVPVGGFFVVEDGCVDIEALRVDPAWPRGVRPAIDDWLETAEGSAFCVRLDVQLYGMTCHPGGFLQRQRAPSARSAPSSCSGQRTAESSDDGASARSLVSELDELSRAWRGPLNAAALVRAERSRDG